MIATFGIFALDERFEFIRQLGRVFIIQPEILKSYINETYLGRIDISLLKPYLALRSDWSQFEKNFNDATDDAANGSNGSIGLKDRFGRLSVMMKDLEGLKVIDGLGSAMPAIPTMPASFAGAFSMHGRSS